MTRLLRIDASSRHGGSHSRRLADAFEAAHLAAHPGSTVTRRDLSAVPVPHISGPTIDGFYTPAEARDRRMRAAVALSDQLIAELRAAELLVVATPMYNFGLPSALKAWLDQVIRIHETVAHDGRTFRGLLGGRRAVVLVAAGASGYGPGGPLAHGDFVVPYLTFVLGFLGFDAVEAVTAEATNGDPAEQAGCTEAALRRIERLAAA
ncbi:MAG TPA: NAD(P)H-dependent oxidoreductase [Paracoccaceae bacterium]|nr:NAD(P)H-dependent oxidoreductase [Paracoccaceae bacterium]